MANSEKEFGSIKTTDKQLTQLNPNDIPRRIAAKTMSKVASNRPIGVAEETVPLRFEKMAQCAGLLASIAFFVFTCLLFWIDKFDQMSEISIRLYCVLMVILGGPLPYFFAGSITRLEINTLAGKLTLGSGYAISFGAVLFLQPWQPWHQAVAYRTLRIDNMTDSVNVSDMWVRTIGYEGSIFMSPQAYIQRPGVPRDSFEYLCRFQGQQTEDLLLTFTVNYAGFNNNSNSDTKQFRVKIPRNGDGPHIESLAKLLEGSSIGVNELTSTDDENALLNRNENLVESLPA